MPQGPSPQLFIAFVSMVVLTIFCAYTMVLGSGLVLFLLLSVSIWHTIENDEALERIYANKGRKVGLRRDFGHHLLGIGCTVAIISLAAAATSPSDRAFFTMTPLAFVTGESVGIASRVAIVATGLLGTFRLRDARQRIAGAALVLSAVTIPYHIWSWLSLAELRTGVV